MKKKNKLVFMQKLFGQAMKTWILIFNLEDEVKSCQEAWRVRSLAERAFRRVERRGEALEDYKRLSGLH